MALNAQPTPQRRTWPALVQLVLLSALLTAAIALVLTYQLLPSRYHFNEGDVANLNIKSPRKVTYVSQIATKAERERAAAAVPEQTQFDAGAFQQQLNKADDVLRQIGDLRRDSASLDEKQKRLALIPGLTISSTSAHEALTMDDVTWMGLTAEVKRVLGLVMNERFTDKQVPDQVKRLSNLVDQGLTPERRALVSEIAGGLVRRTVYVDEEATTAAREAAVAAVEPIRVTVEQGEIILRDGDVVKQLDIEKLEQVGLANPSVNWNDALGNVLLAAVLVTGLASFLYLFQPTTWPNLRRLTLVYGAILAALLAAKLTIPGREMFAYVFPVAALPMLLTTLLDVQLAIVAIGVLAPLLGIVAGGSLELATASFIAGLIGLLGIWRMERQSTAFLAGLGVGAVTFLAVTAFKLTSQDVDLAELAMIGFICLVNGALSTALTLGMASVLGHIFGITTTPGLLELAHPSQPLFRRLLTEAPGTYHHSVIVANLAERAAQTVDADPLLARVAAYYHDIGKVARPYCFVENQVDGQNIHDRLNPHMSAKLVAAHVKDGLQLAKQHSLPSKVRDVIEQHHGTRLVKYFYHQACRDNCEKHVIEEDFRYSGPRPQTKEAAIMMLADSVEAGVRSEEDHSAEHIARTINRIVNEIVVEGQLDECDLSLRDLQKIREAFANVLQGIFHPRVKYPEETADAAAGEPAARTVPTTSGSPASQETGAS